MLSDELPASRGQPRTPAEVLQRVWWAGDGKGGDRDRPQAVSQVRAPRHAPWTQRAAPKLGTDVPQHPQKTARTLVRLLRASEALWASCTRLEHKAGGAGFIFEFLANISARRRPICTSRCMQPGDIIRNSCPSGTFPHSPVFPPICPWALSRVCRIWDFVPNRHTRFCQSIPTSL